MTVSPLAGRPAPAEVLVDVPALLRAYEGIRPDPGIPSQRVAFGTSGHRGTSTDGSFNEDHILAIAQAICDHRREAAIDGPLFLGKDTHALSGPAERTVLEVLAANGVETVVAHDGGFAPTPVISREILVHNRGRTSGLADGVVVTPSHNPPSDGGIKYNPPHGGPAGSDVTKVVEARANALLAARLAGVRRMPYARAQRAPTVHRKDYVASYVGDLPAAIDVEAIRSAGVTIGADPLGGSALPYLEAVAEVHGLDLTVVNTRVDPRFAFMAVDHDGRIRMDCSSPWAMTPLVWMKDDFDVAFGNDPDADRHGIVTGATGLMDPNRFLAVAIRHLLAHRPDWPGAAAIGKTLVSSAVVDRVVEAAGRRLFEVPVGFKWFAEGLASGALAFAGEESAGASFLRRDGTAWTTDKDGILLGLLAAEIVAVTGRGPGEHFEDIASSLGRSWYRRVDRAATSEQRARLASLSPASLPGTALAGEEIVARLTHAPANGAPIGGLKVVARSAWFAARPSGTEPIVKIYAESFLGEAHLEQVLEEAQAIVAQA